MNKKLAVLTALFLLSAGLVFAEGEMEAAAEVAAVAPVEVGNTICPLTGRTLNLEDAADFTKLEAEGHSFNVCPMAKTAYDSDPALFADKIAAAVGEAKAAAAAPAAEAAPEAASAY